MMIFQMSVWSVTRRVLAVVAVLSSALCLCGAEALAEAPAKAPAGKVIEGFEDLSAVPVRGGKLSTVKAGAGVTEGKQAALMPGHTELILRLDGSDCSKLPWLRIDTHAGESRTRPVKLIFSALGMSITSYAYVRLGKDTLSAPLSVIRHPDPEGWPEGPIRFVLVNEDDSALTLDNIRLEPATPPPPGSILLDFGPDSQALWPGFQSATDNNPHLRWREYAWLRRGRSLFPDPLAADYCGPAGSGAEHFHLKTPTNQPAVGWLWVTHYDASGGRGAEYAFKFRGTTKLRKKLSARKLLGPHGVLAGIDGDWTPEWFDTVQAKRYVDTIRVDLRPGKNRVDIMGCQIAALAMAPASQQRRLGEFVKQLEKDISTYRRQFVLGFRSDPACNIEPSEAEKKNKLMLFGPTSDQAFLADWIPGADDRIRSIKAIVPVGGFVAIPLAVVPTRKSSSFSGVVGTLRNKKGQILTAAVTRAEVLFAERVPRLRHGRVEFIPWILTTKAGPAEEKSIVHLAVSLQIPPRTAAGEYAGTIRLSCSGGRVQIPIELEILDVGADTPAVLTAGTLDRTYADYACYTLSRLLSQQQRYKLSKNVREQLLRGGLNSLTLSAPGLSSGGSRLHEQHFVSNMKACPVKHLTGATFIDLASPLAHLRDRQIVHKSGRFRKAIAKVVRRARFLAKQRGIRECYFYCGAGYNESALVRTSTVAKAVEQAGGAAAVRISFPLLAKLPEKRATALLTPFRAFILSPSPRGYAAKVDFLKDLPGKRKVYVYCYPPDRYLSGFFAGAAGTDGYVVRGVFKPGGPYDGGHVNGRGVVMLNGEGDFNRTVASIRLRQGADDALLLARAELLLESARKAKAPAEELAAAVQAVKSWASGGKPLSFNQNLLRTRAPSPVEMNEWRETLIRQAGEAAKLLKTSK